MAREKQNKLGVFFVVSSILAPCFLHALSPAVRLIDSSLFGSSLVSHPRPPCSQAKQPILLPMLDSLISLNEEQLAFALFPCILSLGYGLLLVSRQYREATGLALLDS